MLFGIGTDYILFLLFRYRERLRGGEDAKQAMVSAVTRVGEVIASAAGVVIVAFLALVLSTLSVLRSMGPALAIAVARHADRRADAGPRGRVAARPAGVLAVQGRGSGSRGRRGSRAIGRALGRRPAVFAAVSGLVLVALALGALGFKPTSTCPRPASRERRVADGAADLEKGLPPGATDPTDVFLHSHVGPAAGRLDARPPTARKLKTLPGVGAVGGADR